MEEEECLGDSLQQVDEQIESPQMGQFVSQNCLKLVRRQAAGEGDRQQNHRVEQSGDEGDARSRPHQATTGAARKAILRACLATIESKSGSVAGRASEHKR